MTARWFAAALGILLMASATGCLGVSSPVFGVLVTDDVQWDGFARGQLGTKEGRACAKSYFAVFATGDASIKTAAANGGITNVMSVDRESRWIVVFGEYCTIVRGT